MSVDLEEDAFEEQCAECFKTFNPLDQGKLRQNEWFCSLQCADKAYPEFNQRKKED